MALLLIYLSYSEIEDLPAERGTTVSYETIRLWCRKRGQKYARRLQRKHRGYGTTFYSDEVLAKINGKQHYVPWAVDSDVEDVCVFRQTRRDHAAAKRFFKRLLQSHCGEPGRILAEKLRSYRVAHRDLRVNAFGEWSKVVA